MQSGFYPERLLGWISPSLFSSHGVHLLLPWALRLRWLHTTFQPWFYGVCVFLRMYHLYLVFCFSSLILTRKLDIPILCDSANDLFPQSPGLDSCWATIFHVIPISLTLSSRFWLCNTNVAHIPNSSHLVLPPYAAIWDCPSSCPSVRLTKSLPMETVSSLRVT